MRDNGEYDLISSLLPGTREDFAIGGGVIQGQDLGTREGFNDPLKKPGDYKYSGVQQHLAGENKGQFYFKIRNPNYEGKGSGTPSTLNMGPYKTKKEAEKKYIERQSKMGDIKVSAKNKTIRDQTLKINNFLDNFIDNNLNKFGIRDYEKFKEQLNKAFEKSGIKDIPGRKAKAGDLPNLGTYESEVPFTKFNLEPAFKQKIRKDLGVSSNIENFYKKIFFSGVLENNPDFKNKISKYLDYENIDKKFYKGNPNQIDRTAINKEYADVLTPKFKKDFIYMMNEMANPVLRGTIFKKYFGPKYENYIKKRNTAMLKYEQDKKIIEAKFTPEELKKILGETSIKKFMNKQHELLNKIFDTSVFTGADKGFTFAADHLEGIAEIAKYENKDDIARGLLNVVGTTADRNRELGWNTLSRQRGDLINKIQKGVNVDANVEELNRITKLSYPDIKGDEFYKYDPKTKNVIPTKDFTVKYSPEEGFKRYFTELSYDPRSLKILKSQYKTNPNFKDFVQKDPELTSAIDKTYNKMIEVLQNPKFKNILQNSGLTLRGLSQMRRGNIPGFLSTMDKLVTKNPDLRVELGDPYKDIENQIASASIMSDVSPVQKETTQENDVNEPATAAALAVAGRYGPGLLKNTFKTIGSPVVSAGLSVSEMMSEDPNMALAGGELLLPDIYKRVANKVPTGFIDNVLGLQGLNTLVDKYPILRKFKPVANVVAKSPKLMTPSGLALIGKDIYDEFDKGIGFDMRGPLEEKELLDMREKETYMGNIADSFDEAYKQNTPLPGQGGIDTLKQKFAVGGRVNFADGPDDPSKRKFMKGVGILASVPILGRFFDVAQFVDKAAPVAQKNLEGIPDFLTDLIAKVKLKAEATGMKYFTGNKPEEFTDVYKADNYVVTEQGNKTIIREVDQDGDMLYKENQIEIEVDPETGGVTYREASARPDAEGKLKDVEEYIEEDDLENMRKYTYGE